MARKVFKLIWQAAPSIVSAIWVAFISAAVSGGFSLLVEPRVAEQARLAEARAEDIKDFETAVEEFTIKFGAFASAVAEGAAAPEARQSLLDNLIQQYSRAGEISTHLPEEKRSLVAEYQEAVLKLRGMVPSTDKVTRMRPFWEAANDVLLAKDDLVAALNTSSPPISAKPSAADTATTTTAAIPPGTTGRR